MNWKDISKTSYTISVEKFKEWAPPVPLSFPVEGNKISYNEGDEITTADSPIFDVDFTENPISLNHIPCGYWYKEYVPMAYDVYTSRPYPVYSEDLCVVSSGIISGDLSTIYDLFSYIDSAIVDSSIVSGSLNNIFISYNCPPTDIVNTSGSIVSGSLNNIFINYTIPPEDIIVVNSSIISGSLNEIYIVYPNWPPETVIVNSSIQGGSHVSV